MKTFKNIRALAKRIAVVLPAILLAGLAVGPLGVAAQGSPTGFEVGSHFQQYYGTHDGLRVLGYAVSNESLLPDSGSAQPLNIPIQYYQKGRIEYQGNMGGTGDWEYTYGLLVPELIANGGALAVSNSSVTYQQLQGFADPAKRVNPPEGFAGGTQRTSDQLYVFVPYNSTLQPAPGYLVPDFFWQYITGPVFPAGWLHDLGLPVSSSFQTKVTKDGQERTIQMQAFERGILTYDPQNPADFQVERANVGFDYITMIGGVPAQ